MSKERHVSKFMSLVLRHKPEAIGLILDSNGWADVDELISKMNSHGTSITLDELRDVVANNDKKRYVMSDDGRQIRAAQGHSIKVELELKKEIPPFTLYHGTVARNIDAIRKGGLLKMNRNHVHLSKDENTANIVGGRRGVPIILTIAAKHMHNDGHAFFLSANGVWLTDTVPVKYITFP